MEPCRTAVKAHRRLHRPFAVVPFLFYYETNELSQFMRTHLDPPFNERFSKFIQIVRMNGTDYVRLSTKDLGRLCDGEGDHVSDLQILQNALYKPRRKQKSPHGGQDIFGPYTAELTFDYPDDDEVEPVFECIIPLPSTPSPRPSIELPSDEEARDAESTPATPSSPSSDEGDDGESLIDMFSPVSPAMGPFSELSEGDPSSHSAVPDVFDEEHLESLCSSPTSPVYEGDEGVDILGLLSRDRESQEQEELGEIPPVPEETEMESGSDICGSETAEFGGDDMESSAAGEHSPLDDTLLSLPPTPRARIAEIPNFEISLCPSPPSSPLSNEGPLLVSGGGAHEQSKEIPDSPSVLSRDVHLYPTESTAGSPHSTLSTQTPLPDPDVTSESSAYGDDHEVDIDDLRTVEDESGLSSFLPDLRSLDFSLPPSPRFDALSGCDSLSFGFPASPDPTSIHTPSTTLIGDDAFTIASPSAPYRAPHEGFPEFFFNPERIVAKKLDLALGLEAVSVEVSDATVARRPHLELTIPALPSLLEDEELTSWMSSIGLTRSKSQGLPSSLAPPSSTFSLARPSSTGSDRSIWPVRSDVVGRHLPSPHMKEPSKSPRVPEAGEDVVEENPQENFESTTHIEHGEGASDYQPLFSDDSHSSLPSEPPSTSPPSHHRLHVESHSVLGRVGGFLRAILTPVEMGEDVEGRLPLLPGGLS